MDTMRLKDKAKATETGNPITFETSASRDSMIQ